MIGRPKEFDREQALEAAMAAFWERGYEATSVQDLLDAMGINRGSMYDTFGDKHALFREAVQQYGRMMGRWTMQILDAPGSPLANVRSLITVWRKRASSGDTRGCLICNTAVELSPHDPVVAETVSQVLEGLEKALHRKLKEARDAGELKAQANPRALARFLVNTLQGLAVMVKTGAGPAVVRDILDTAESVLE